MIVDADGVMTDGTVSYPNKERWFSVRDGHGFQLLKERTNIVPFIMSGENDQSIKHRANKLQITCSLGVGNKYAEIAWLVEAKFIHEHPTKYIAISDDVPDLELLQNATLAFCPADAEDEVKSIDGIIVLAKKGGEGCVREAINIILTQPWIQELFPELVIT
jgi:YrbI family 3-deoxy-D-manno-octulosonate 8-phosphate phosphatase